MMHLGDIFEDHHEVAGRRLECLSLDSNELGVLSSDLCPSKGCGCG